MPIIKKIIIKKQDYTFIVDNSLEMDALNFKRSITILKSDDALFSTGTGLERVGVVGLDQDC